MNVRSTLLLAAVTLAATSSTAFAQDEGGEMDGPERAQNSAPWPTFHRALNGEVVSAAEEGTGGVAPDRAQNSAPWPTFHRALNGEVAPVSAGKKTTLGASLRRMLRTG